MATMMQTRTNSIYVSLQGPTGVSGPKGARGAQGPPVGDNTKINDSFVGFFFLFCDLTCFSFRVLLVSLALLVELDPQVLM